MADGAEVGRIFMANASPVGASWMWTVAFGQHEDRTLLANPTGDFESLSDAREMAFKDANRPDMRAHSIIIETVDDGSIDERWVRNGNSETFVAMASRGAIPIVR